MERLFLTFLFLCGVEMRPGGAAPSMGQSLNVVMPRVRPSVNDEVLCHSQKISGPTFITSFIPHAKMATAHHMLLFACPSPGTDKKVWRCGEMDGEVKVKDNLPMGPVCKGGEERIIYAWAMDAPTLKLPEGVSFSIGGDTGLEYLVLQVHYKNVSKFTHDKKAKDESGVIMKYQTKPTAKLGGVYLLATGGVIPRGATVHMETACSYNHGVTLHPFAFRTHAHKLGQVVAGYRVRGGKWTEIGRKSPQLPQMFYNTTTPNLLIKKGDILAARCIMKNFHKDHDVSIGNTQNDEMCNFYMMFWVPSKDAKVLSSNDLAGCVSSGWPKFKWSDILPVAGVPETAAQIPNTKDSLPETINRDKFLQEVLAEMELEQERAEQRFASLQRELEAEEAEAEAEALRNALPQEEEQEVNRRGVPFFNMGEDYDGDLDPVARNLW